VFVHQGKSGGSYSRREERPSFFDFFGRRRHSFDGGFFDWSNDRSYRSGEPVAIDEPEPTESIDVYQTDPLVSLSAGALTEAAPAEPLSQAIYGELLDSANAVRVTPDEKRTIIALYKVNGFKPLWATTDGGLTARGRDVLAYLAASAEDGMEPLDYLPAVLGSFTDDVAAMTGDLPRLARLDLGLTAAALHYARQASGGRLTPNRLTSYDDITPEPVNLDQAIKVLAWSPFPVAYLRNLQPQHPAYAAF
jgi:murein L,D-transpeptidase YcbB/YkuD